MRWCFYCVLFIAFFSFLFLNYRHLLLFFSFLSFMGLLRSFYYRGGSFGSQSYTLHVTELPNWARRDFNVAKLYSLSSPLTAWHNKRSYNINDNHDEAHLYFLVPTLFSFNSPETRFTISRSHFSFFTRNSFNTDSRDFLDTIFRAFALRLEGLF